MNCPGQPCSSQDFAAEILYYAAMLVRPKNYTLTSIPSQDHFPAKCKHCEWVAVFRACKPQQPDPCRAASVKRTRKRIEEFRLIYICNFPYALHVSSTSNSTRSTTGGPKAKQVGGINMRILILGPRRQMSHLEV